MNKTKIREEIYSLDLNALEKQNMSPKEILEVCREAINDSMSATTKTTQNFLDALYDAWNLNQKEFNRTDIFCMAKSFNFVFAKGYPDTHSQLQRENYEKFRKGFLNLSESDRNFLIQKYPNFGIFN